MPKSNANTIYLNNKKFIDSKVKEKESLWKSTLGADWVMLENIPDTVFDQMRDKWIEETVKEFHLN